MASKYGFTVKKILDMDMRDINRLDKDQMRDALKVMNDAANKRAKRLEEAGQTQAFAYQHAKPKNADELRFRTPTTTDKTQSRNVLYKSLVNVTNFVKSKTSTVSGWKKTKSTIIKAMKGDSKKSKKAEQDEDGEDLDEMEFEQVLNSSDFWKFVRNLMSSFAYDSTSAIQYATVYSTNYNTIDKMQRAVSYVIGAEVDESSIANTPTVDIWSTIFANSDGSLKDLSRTTGYQENDYTDYDDEEFNDIWRNS